MVSNVLENGIFVCIDTRKNTPLTHSELESEISFGNIKQDLSLILQSLWPLDAGNVSH